MKYRMAFTNLDHLCHNLYHQSDEIKFSAKSTTWKKSTVGIKKYFEMADNENITYHNWCDVAKVLL